MALSIVSCSQEELNEFNKEVNHYHAIIADAELSRTSLNEGSKVFWLSGDDISMILKSGYHYRYVVSGSVNSTSTEFSLDNSTTYINIGKQLPNHYAIYPYSSNTTVSDDNINVLNVDVTNWAEQIYAGETFEDDKAIMTAKSKNTNLSFFNAFSLLQFELSADVMGCYSISSITVTSANYALNGPATIDMSLEKPHLECIGNSLENKTNTLTLSTPVYLEVEPKYFYLLIPAKTYDAGDLTINIKGTNLMDDTELDWTHTMDNPIECIRSKYTTLRKVFKDLGFTGSTDGDELKTLNNIYL